MTTTTFVPVSYVPNPKGVINAGDGNRIDIQDLLLIGSGEITVDSTTQNVLYEALRAFPHLAVSTVRPSSPAVIGPIYGHRVLHPSEDMALPENKFKAEQDANRAIIESLLEQYRDNRPQPVREVEKVETLGNQTTAPTVPVIVDVTYAVVSGINAAALVGATTTEPNGQAMLDVYSLISPLINFLGNVNAQQIPMPIGGDGSGQARTITVAQDSIQDIALSAFPSLVQRIS
jgi:hypothetical protein